MARLIFTDSEGTVTLTNGLEAIAGGVGSRFRNWTPFQIPVGPAVTSLGTGARSQFAFRTDYGASFAMEEIPVTRLSQVLRLQAHLLGGGIVRVETDDLSGAVYPNCCLAPSGEVGLELTDSAEILYTVRVTLINLNAARMLCVYGGPVGDVLIFGMTPDNITAGTFARTGTATYQALGS